MAPFDPDVDPVREALALVEELRKYDESLYAKPRWIVLNKIDLVPEAEQDDRIDALIEGLDLKADDRVFVISAATREGCEELISAIAQYLDDEKRRENQYVDDERVESEVSEVPMSSQD